MGKVLGCLGVVLLCGLAGLVLGFYVGSGVIEGFYTRWETMTLAEGLHPTNLVTGDAPIAYLQTEEGELLMHGCASRTYPGTTNWQSETGIISMAAFLEHNVECIQEEPYQNWPTMSKPRSTVQAQVYCIAHPYAEVGTQCRYALLEDGTTQLWHNSSSIGGFIIVIGDAMLGSGFGAVIGASGFVVWTKCGQKKEHNR